METDEKTCREYGTGALSSDKMTELLREVPKWSLRDKAIEREFQFKDFREAMEFVNRVGTLSESEDHHPDIYVSYSTVRLTLSTHKIQKRFHARTSSWRQR